MKNLLLLLTCLLISCTSQRPTDSVLPILDVSKDYPVREVNINDIADVDYVALETNDSSLLPGYCFFYASDKYIIATDYFPVLNIFIFNSSGKFIRKINHRGPGDKEYVDPHQLVIDFDQEEFFFVDRRRLLVYSFDGTFKYSTPLDGGINLDTRLRSTYYNYDKEHLIMYNADFNHKTKRSEDEHPYYLINKKDGTKHPLDINIPNRITSITGFQQIYDSSGKFIRIKPARVPLHQLLKNGNDFLISDPALDTLYSFKENKLTPIAVQYPAVRANNPPIVISPFVYTDSYMLFKPISLYYCESDHKKPLYDAPRLTWNRKTNQIERWRMTSPDFPYVVDYDGVILYCYDGIEVISDRAEGLIELNNRGFLKGRLKEIASKLDEEDNHVVTIIKYK